MGMMKRSLFSFSLLLGASVGMLAACETIVHEPTHLSQSKIKVEEDKIFEDVAVDALDADSLLALSHHYNRHGDGGIDLTVTYDPGASQGSAMRAGDDVVRIAKALRDGGADRVNANILPVKDQGPQSRALISYRAYTASGPDDCGDIPGLKEANVDSDEDYELGCSLKAVMAKQIARPKDMRDRSHKDTTSDGRAASNIIEAYRTGARNEPLDGESASDN